MNPPNTPRRPCETWHTPTASASRSGRTGVCWDNAMAESFFATMKNELIHRHPWPTQARAKTAVITWIEGRYNRRRRHSAIGMIPPVQFEAAARHVGLWI